MPKRNYYLLLYYYYYYRIYGLFYYIAKLQHVQTKVDDFWKAPLSKITQTDLGHKRNNAIS